MREAIAKASQRCKTTGFFTDEANETRDFDGTASPARTGDPQIHNLVL